MLDKFRNLSDKGKIIVVGSAIAVFIVAIVILGIFLGSKAKPVEVPPTDLPYASSTASPTPSPSPSVTPSATATATASAKPGSNISYGQTTLSVEDQQSAQSVAKDGVLNYFKVDKGESMDATNERLKNYFAAESGVFGENSLNNYFSMQKTGADDYITSEGSIDYLDPVGGDTKVYKVLAGMTYRAQFNRTNEVPQILERNGIFTLLLSKESGSWKIISIDDGKG